MLDHSSCLMNPVFFMSAPPPQHGSLLSPPASHGRRTVTNLFRVACIHCDHPSWSPAQPSDRGASQTPPGT